jgi:hypothetical protein
MNYDARPANYQITGQSIGAGGTIISTYADGATSYSDANGKPLYYIGVNNLPQPPPPAPQPAPQPIPQPVPASVTTWNPPAGPIYYPSAPVYNPPPPPAPIQNSTPAPTTRPPTPAPTTPAPTTPTPTTPTPTQSPTSAAPITPAPTTRAPTPAPTPAPMPPPSYLRYPSNLVVFVHEGEWMNKGILKVLTLRGSTPSLQAFAYKDLTQVFAIDGRGAVRCVADQGTYVNLASTCDGVVGGSNASEWRFVDRDLPRSYSLEVKCAVGTRRIEFSSMVHPWAILLGGTAGSTGAQGGGWFIVPIARVDG